MDDRTKNLLDRAQGITPPDSDESSPIGAQPQPYRPSGATDMRGTDEAAEAPGSDAVGEFDVHTQVDLNSGNNAAQHLNTILEAHNIQKTYRLGKVDVPVLRGASISVREGELIAILGASGSGKSTLLHILGGLDTPDTSATEVRYLGTPLRTLSQGKLNRYRNKDVGFVFQFYHLLPELSVLQNAMVPAMMGQSRLSWARQSRGARERAEQLLDVFGLSSRLKHRPTELSGGERQRVAIARALINQPTVLLADEPTGNLDRQTGDAILDAMIEARKTSTRAMVIVTHDAETAARADRVVRIEDGQVVDG